MSSRVQQLTERGLIHPPPFLPKNVHYEVITGSVAYGVNSCATSDIDIYGFCIPPKDEIFPHLRGEIQGFGRQKKRFDQFIQHHIEDAEARKEYDFTIFSIVKFFSLCMENNPNMVDVLFVPANCIVYSSQVGQMVREKRHIFLHKGSFFKYKGYAYSQMHKMRNIPDTVTAIRKFEFTCNLDKSYSIDDVKDELARRTSNAKSAERS